MRLPDCPSDGGCHPRYCLFCHIDGRCYLERALEADAQERSEPGEADPGEDEA